VWRLLSTVISEVNNTKRGREGGVKKQLFGPHKHTRRRKAERERKKARYIAEIFFARKRTTDVLLTHSAGLFFLRVQSVKGERKERVGEVFVFPQRARSSWVKSRERKKGKSTGKISLFLSLFPLFLSRSPRAAVRGKEIIESRARSFEKERILDR